MSLQQVSYILDAVLKDNTQTPISGKQILFSHKLAADPAFTQDGSSTTDANGLASSATLVLTAPSVYDFVATFNGDVLFQMSSVQVVYDTSASTIPTSVTATISPASPLPTDTVTVLGTLASNPAGSGPTPLPGEAVSVSLDGGAGKQATTDATGTFTATFGPGLSSGAHMVTVVYAGTTFYLGSSHQSAFTVQGGVTMGGFTLSPAVIGIAAAVTALAVVGGVMAVRRKKR